MIANRLPSWIPPLFLAAVGMVFNLVPLARADDAPPIPATPLSQSRLLDLPAGKGPLKVGAAFNLLEIYKVDDEAETFEFTGILTLTWRDPRQAFEPKAMGVDEMLYNGAYQFNELSPAWYPQVILSNASSIDDPQGILLRVKPDGTSTLIQTIHAVAKSKLNLRRYPFDRQNLTATFEVLGFDETEVVLEAGGASADASDILAPQWDFTGISASSRSVPAPHAGPGRTSTELTVTVDVRRQSFFLIRLVIIPLGFIVMLSWSVFWMDRSSLGDRMGVSFVGILTAVAYQIVVSDLMPHISYFTLMHAFLNFSFVLMVASVAINLIVGASHRANHTDDSRGERIDRRCRWAFPLAYVGLMAIAATITLVFF